MTKPVFNLHILDDPWVVVTTMDGKEETLSLIQVLMKSNSIRCLSNEMVTQDVAILRLLLSVLYVIYTRNDDYQKACKNTDTCIQFWKKLWQQTSFSAHDLNKFRNDYHDGFWLKHPEKPFYQVPDIEKGSDFLVSKMIGSLVEGGNKTLLFPERTGNSKRSISYPEAVRWLLYLNSFDDAAAKPTQKGLHPMSVGWLGRLGLVYIEGRNLFETLMLNFSLINPNNGKPWSGKGGHAAWELDKPNTGERVEISVPHHAETLYTLQSRRIQLKYADDKVIGFTILGGDQFEIENAFVEPMTIWKKDKTKSNQSSSYFPPSNAGRNPSKQAWRDFSSLLAASELTNPKDERGMPGVLMWIKELVLDEVVLFEHIQICTLFVKYGSMQSGIEEVWSDSLSVNANIFASWGDDENGWTRFVTETVKDTEVVVHSLGSLALDLASSSGATDFKNIREQAQEQAYAALDLPFREWLGSINSLNSDMDERKKEWCKITKGIILTLGENLVSQAGMNAFTGRVVKKKDRESYYSSPEAYDRFFTAVSRKLKSGEGK